MAVERIPIESRGAWLAMRGININASEVAAVCGESPYGTLAALYAEKKGTRPPQIDTGVLRRGRWGEAVVFEALVEELPDWEIARARIYLRDQERRLGATPDGFALRPGRPDRGIVQCKTVARSVFRRQWLSEADTPIEFGDAAVPAHYRLQVLTEMMLEDCAWAILAAVVFSEFDLTLRLFEIQRDAVIEQRIVDHVAAFWRDHFDRNVPPPFDPVKDEELVKRLYPMAGGTVIDLAGDNRATALVDEFLAAQADRKRATEIESAAKTELQAKLGENTYGRLADGRCIQWKNEPRKAHEVPATNPRVLRIRKSLPQLANGADDE